MSQESDLSKLDAKELREIIKQKDKEIKNLKISLDAQVNISTIATHELNKAKGRIKDKKIKTEKEILDNQEKELREKEAQFKTRKFN